MNEEHVSIVLSGPAKLAEWREQNPNMKLDLVNAALEVANLREAILRGANLRGASLRGANLFGANLRAANLRGANLCAADLRVANLRGANLQGANLQRADLQESDLFGANLQDANLESAVLNLVNLRRCRFRNTFTANIDLGETLLVDIDLIELMGDGITHEMPSIVDLRSLRKLNGRIDSSMENFLRQLGMDQWEIEVARTYDTALDSSEVSDHLYKAFDMRTPGAFYLGGVFVSYAHKEAEFVDKLVKVLKAKDITVYLDRHDFTAGSIEKNISHAIRINDQVVLVLSEDALNSDWVWDEIASTLEKEKALDKDVLFPICVDDSWKADQRNKRRLMRQIEERVILDFSKPKDFDTNLRKLITGMKVNQ